MRSLAAYSVTVIVFLGAVTGPLFASCRSSFWSLFWNNIKRCAKSCDELEFGSNLNTSNKSKLNLDVIRSQVMHPGDRKYPERTTIIGFLFAQFYFRCWSLDTVKMRRDQWCVGCKRSDSKNRILTGIFFFSIFLLFFLSNLHIFIYILLCEFLQII